MNDTSVTRAESLSKSRLTLCLIAVFLSGMCITGDLVVQPVTNLLYSVFSNDSQWIVSFGITGMAFLSAPAGFLAGWMCDRMNKKLVLTIGFAIFAVCGIFGGAVQNAYYALTRPAVAAVMAGFETPEQARECCAYEDATEEERDFMRTLARAPRHAFGEAQCTYCGHCQPCVKGIQISQVNKFADLAAMQDEVPASLLEHYRALDRHASDCIGCRRCEGNCPFGVKIAEKMQKTAELFGF